MKKHSFAEHEKDVQTWWFDNHNQLGEEQRRTNFFIAYERWVNDRPLLRDDDGAAP